MNIMGELALIFGICLVGEGISSVLPFIFPGSVIALLLMAALLFTGLLKPKHIERASGFFVANMAFFFLPSCVGMMERAQDIWPQLLPFLFITVITTPLVYGVTGWTVQWMMRRKRKGAPHA